MTVGNMYLAGTGFKFEIKRCEEVLPPIVHPRLCRESALDLGLEGMDDLIVSRHWTILLR